MNLELDRLESIYKRNKAAYEALPAELKDRNIGQYYLSAMNRAKDKLRQIREVMYG
jgi:hypothetical protein